MTPEIETRSLNFYDFSSICLCRYWSGKGNLFLCHAAVNKSGTCSYEDCPYWKQFPLHQHAEDVNLEERTFII